MDLKIYKRSVFYHIISIVVMMNIFQLGLVSLNIRFNMVIYEYVLLLIVVILEKNRLSNYANLVILFIALMILLFMNMIKGTIITQIYYQQFIYYAVPILILFSYEIEYEKFIEIFKIYCFLCIILYLINLYMRTNLVKDYMTYGYGLAFPLIFFIVYYFIKKKLLWAFIYILISGFVFFNGSRFSFIIILIAILICIISTNYSLKVKIPIISFIVGIMLFGQGITVRLISHFASGIGAESYAIKQFLNMVKADSAQSLLGSRYYLYRNAIIEIKNNFPFGLGVGGFEYKYGIYPHNIILDALCTFGVFGVVYMIFLVNIGVKASKKRELCNVIFLIFCISISCKLLFSKSFIYDPYIWLYIAYCTNCINQQRREKNIE